MKIALISLFPEMLDALTNSGISGRAFSKGLLQLKVFNPRDYTEDRHKTTDARPYGGGPGMVLMIEPLRRAIAASKEWIGHRTKVVHLSPQGKVLNQLAIQEFSEQESLVLVAGRYEGIDERVIQMEVDEEWSIGDYVLSGGEVPAMVLIDGIIRQLPGALGHSESASQDSFTNGLLDCPLYTRPECYQGHHVPEVLLSGNHKKIKRWRLQQSLLRTKLRRPDLLENLKLNDEQQRLLDQLTHAPADDGKE
jgi:tRNA (guanine37-N1)-methyltransferase